MTPSKIADPLLPEQIAELRALDEKATPGPWKLGPHWGEPNGGYPLEGPTEDHHVADIYAGHHYADLVRHEDGTANGLLIVALRNSLPQLLSAAERGIAAPLFGVSQGDYALAIRRAEKAEADLAASNARIGELSKIEAAARVIFDNRRGAYGTALIERGEVALSVDLEALRKTFPDPWEVGKHTRPPKQPDLLTPTHPETKREAR